MHLCLGGWRLAVVCDPPAVAAAAAQRYAAFTAGATAGPPDLTLTVTFLPATEDAHSQHPLLETRLVVAGTDYLLDAPDIRGRIELTDQRASLRLPSCDPLRDLEYYLRIVMAALAYQRGGLLVHGAALVLDGQAHLFIGQSGSGKSTVVALSPHAVALGDDLVLLRPTAQGWQAYGTPFWNWQAGQRAGQTSQGALRGIYKLVQSPEVRLEPLPRAAAVAELAANCPIVNDVPEWWPGLLGVCRELASAVPVQRLFFRKDNAFWNVIAGGSTTA